jgi:multiple sugar transport system permease protein
MGSWPRHLAAAAKVVFLAALLAWSLTPIVWNIMTSLKVPSQIFDYPPVFIFAPNFDAYRDALGPRGIYPQLQNTVTVAIGTTLVSLAFGVLAAYAFSRYEFRGRQTLMVGLIATRLLPPISAVVPL